MQITIEVKWSEEDKAFVAIADKLPGLSAFGDTKEKALLEFFLVGQGYVEYMIDEKEVL